MLQKKPVDTGRKAEPKGPIYTRLLGYLKYVRSELRKVIWPKRDEMIQSTIIVIITLFVLSLYIMGLDAVFAGLINLITGVNRG